VDLGRRLADPRGRKGVALGLTALVATIVFGFIAIAASRQGSDSPSVPLPGDAPRPTTNVRSAGWGRVPDHPGLFGSSDLEQVTTVESTDAGLIAVGAHSYEPAVWAAPDPDSWERLTRVEPGQGDRPAIIWAVAQHGDTYVAVGSESDHAAVWVSEDAGTWRLVDRSDDVFGAAGEYSAMMSVIWFNDRWLAGGYFSHGDRTPDNAAVWSSSDGHAWSREVAVSAELVGERPTISGLAATSDRVVAVGSISSLVGPVGLRPAIWTSSDGTTWQTIPMPDTGSPKASLPSVSVAHGRWVAVGDDGHDAMIFTSTDGVDWVRVNDPLEYEYSTAKTVMSDVAPTADGWVAVGSAEDSGQPTDAAVWNSADGLEWTRVYADNAIFGGPDRQAMVGVATLESGAVAVGWDASTGSARGAAWVQRRES
jgi:hypothetical protein